MNKFVNLVLDLFCKSIKNGTIAHQIHGYWVATRLIGISQLDIFPVDACIPVEFPERINMSLQLVIYIKDIDQLIRCYIIWQDERGMIHEA